MAAYEDLYDVKNDSDLQEKVAVAIVIAATKIFEDASPPSNQAARLVWASDALLSPGAMVRPMLWAVIAANESATVANILGASDAAIQSNIDDVVDLFAGS